MAGKKAYTEAAAEAKREAFARAQVRGLSIREAAAEAGLRYTGYVTKLAASPEHKARVAALRDEGAKAIMLSIEQLYRTFLEQGTFDPCVFDGVNSLADMKEKVPEAVRALLVKGWKYDRNGRFIIELVDKDKALDRIARHMSFYNDTVKLEVGGYAARLAAARQTIED